MDTSSPRSVQPSGGKISSYTIILEVRVPVKVTSVPAVPCSRKTKTSSPRIQISIPRHTRQCYVPNGESTEAVGSGSTAFRPDSDNSGGEGTITRVTEARFTMPASAINW